MKPQYFLVIITAITLYFLFELFNPYLKAIVVALLLAVATNSLNTYIKNKIPNKFAVSMIMTIFLTFVFYTLA